MTIPDDTLARIDLGRTAYEQWLQAHGFRCPCENCQWPSQDAREQEVWRMVAAAVAEALRANDAVMQRGFIGDVLFLLDQVRHVVAEAMPAPAREEAADG